MNPKAKIAIPAIAALIFIVIDFVAPVQYLSSFHTVFNFATSMKEFLQVLRRFVPPYKKYLALSVLFNILSAVLNIFSFAALIPILQILFQTEKVAVANRLMSYNEASIKEVLSNNADFYVQQLINEWGTSTTLLVIGLLLAVMTFLKTGAYFLSSASIIPIRTGIVRDIRNQLYRKITSLSMG